MSSEEAGQEADETRGAAQPADEELLLTDPKAMRALAHPVRMTLLEMIGVAGTLTATQASDMLGESPANCAFHLRTLAKYGFIKEAGGGRGRERPWTRATRTLSISSTRQTNAQAALAARALSGAWFEHWVERARRVFGTGARVPGWEEATGSTTSALFLTPDETVRLNKEVQALLDRYKGRETNPSLRPPGSLPVEFDFFSSPLAEFAQVTDESQDIS